MLESEPPLTTGERLLLASVYLCLTSLDVLPQRQHPDSEKNGQVGQSHISVSHHLSQNQYHGEAR